MVYVVDPASIAESLIQSLRELASVRENLVERLSEGWFPYFCALGAVALLPFKTRTASRVIALALSLLWAVQRGSTALEAIVLLVLGVILGRLELTARTGPWGAAGTALILYSLIPPVLGFCGVTLFQGLSWSLSPVLFTCGVLFFSAGRTADLALALTVPLVLALMGGPGAAAAQGWGLRVALLLGVFFLLWPRELRTASDRPVPAGTAFLLAHRCRAVFGNGLWALVLVILLLIFVVFGVLSEDVAILPRRIAVNLALLSALGIGVWLLFPAWQALWFRYVVWRVARVAGRLWSWLADAWRWGVLLLLAAAALVSWRVKGNTIEITSLLDWIRKPSLRDTPFWLFLAMVLLWLTFQAYQGRRSLVIGTFTDVTGSGDKPEKWVTGLGARLQNELARIADLYKVIDEARPPQKGSVIEVGAGVQDVGEILKSASALKLGPLQIPMNLVAEIVSRIVNGPRLTGALYKIDNEYVLTAELSGGGLEGNWRVDFSKLSAKERRLPAQAAVHKLVEQLAYRIAAKLVPIGSPRWRAVCSFTEGLRYYRETQQRKSSVAALLREAECSFIRALGDDQRFAQCHYNLGVVYRQLGESHSAESAFRRALTEDAQNFDACYALAETLVHRDENETAVWFCNAAIAIRPDEARAWDLKAYAQRKWEQAKEEERRGSKVITLPPDHPAWGPILEMREIAVALSWRSLCRQALRGPSPALDVYKDAAFMCIRNLGVVLTCTARYHKAGRLFSQAGHLSPRPDLRLGQGRSLFWNRIWSEASQALEGVFADGLDVEDRGLLWSTLARIHASDTDPDPLRRITALLAHGRFLDLAAGASAEALRTIIQYNSSEVRPNKAPGSAWVPPSGPGWESVTDHLAALHSQGLGRGDCEGYRERLARLCRFLIGLEQENETSEKTNAFARLQRALGRGERQEESRDDRIKRLRELLSILRTLKKARDGDKDPYLNPRRSAFLAAIRQRPNESVKDYRERRIFLKTALAHLGIMATTTPAADHFQILHGLLSHLRARATDDASLRHLVNAKKDWQECFDDCVNDWIWARDQVLVRLARLYLEEKPNSSKHRVRASRARRYLKVAIMSRESRGSHQPRDQGLYALLAASLLARAKAAYTPLQERTKLVQKALIHAQRAVEMEPESVRERLVLIEILSLTGDAEEMQMDAEIALHLDSGPETLRTIGAGFWSHAAAQRRRAALRKVLRDAVRFFRNALRDVESAPFDPSGPLEQVQAHGWAHFWLGRFLCECGKHDEAAAHLQTANALGFKPLESRVELAWAYLLGRHVQHAERAFAEASTEAERQTTAGRTVAQGPGEEREIAGLVFDTWLGWAFLAADRDPLRASERLKEAEKLLADSGLPGQEEKRSALSESRGRILLSQKRVSAGVKALEEAVRLDARPGAWCALARVALGEAQGGGPDALAALRRAREAYRLARETDVRGRSRRELWELRRGLRRLEQMAGVRAPKPQSPAPTLSTAKETKR